MNLTQSNPASVASLLGAFQRNTLRQSIFEDQVKNALSFLKNGATKHINRSTKEAYLLRKGTNLQSLNRAFEILEKEELEDLYKSDAARQLKSTIAATRLERLGKTISESKR